MTDAKVFYALSPNGQRDALSKNLNAQAEQTMTVPVINGDLKLFDIASDASLSADARYGSERSWSNHWNAYKFDTVPSAEDLLTFLRVRTVQRAEVVAAEQAAEANKKAQAEQEISNRRHAMLDAIAVANAAGQTSVEGYTVDDTSIREQAVNSWSVNLIKISEHENEHVAAICARRRAAHQAANARSVRIKALPQMPVDYPSTVVSPGVYTANVPDSKYSDNSWAKSLTSVNPGARGGYALNGEWLRDRTTQPSGGIVVVGSKEWTGSRKNGNYSYDVAVYVMTPANLCRVWRGDSTDQAVAKCSQLLDQSESERVETALTSRIATCDKNLATLAALDRDEYREEVEEVTKRVDAWQGLRDRLQVAIDGSTGDGKIVDVDSAAAAIVAAGYRVLAQEHHPDHGGSTETMAFVNEAKRQLRELLKIAAEVQQ